MKASLTGAARIVEEFDVESHGVDHAQYFQGAGADGYDDCATGSGQSEREALEDALDQLSMAGWSFDARSRAGRARQGQGRLPSSIRGARRKGPPMTPRREETALPAGWTDAPPLVGREYWMTRAPDSGHGFWTKPRRSRWTFEDARYWNHALATGWLRSIEPIHEPVPPKRPKAKP